MPVVFQIGDHFLKAQDDAETVTGRGLALLFLVALSRPDDVGAVAPEIERLVERQETIIEIEDEQAGAKEILLLAAPAIPGAGRPCKPLGAGRDPVHRHVGNGYKTATIFVGISYISRIAMIGNQLTCHT